MDIDATVVGDIITHERTTWTNATTGSQTGVLEEKEAWPRRPLGLDGEVFVCPQAL